MAFFGALLGPVLAVILLEARIGPAGLYWWEGKGGETFMTPLGRTIFLIIFVGGAILGAACGAVIEPRMAAGRPAKASLVD